MKLGTFATTFLTAHPAEAARVLETFPLVEAQSALDAISVPVAAKCLAQIVPAVAAELLATFAVDRAGKVLSELPVAVSARLLRRLPRSRRTALLSGLSKSLAMQLRMVLKFSTDTVGSRVDPHVVTLKDGMTVEAAIALARRTPRLLKKYFYITDDEDRLTGVVDVRQCLVAPPYDTPLESFVERDVVFLRARANVQTARRDTNWRRFAILPVIDRDNVLLGVVRAHDLGTAGEDDDAYQTIPGPLTAALDVAELYWDTASRLFLPVSQPPKAERNDVRG